MDYKFHYHTRKNWINDPNGLCFYNGLFHIYYQHNPKGIIWGNMCWGHTTTKDFIHYKEEKIALYNDSKYDSDGVFSGNSIIINNTLYVYYTSVLPNHPTQSVAYSIDGYNFTKYESNPIIDTNSEARDPYVFIDNDTLYMIIGTQDKILLYKGKNPFEFEYVSDLLEFNEFIECPNLIKIGNKYLFKYSSMVHRKDFFYLGTFDGMHFIKEKGISIKLPNNYYASQMFKHNNEIILIGWINKENDNKPYTGLLSIPRIVYLEDDLVKTKPVKALEKYLTDNKIIDNDIIEEF